MKKGVFFSVNNPAFQEKKTVHNRDSLEQTVLEHVEKDKKTFF
nr:hypothetical protein [Evansella caseinilytica]